MDTLKPKVLTAGGVSSSDPLIQINGRRSEFIGEDKLSSDRAGGGSHKLKSNAAEENDAVLKYENNSDEYIDDEESTEGLALLRESQMQLSVDDLYSTHDKESKTNDIEHQDGRRIDGKQGQGGEHSSGIQGGASSNGQILWLFICFFGIMGSFVAYGLLLEYATSGGRKLHELSFLFVTSLLYTCTAAAGRHVRDEVPTTIPPARFAVLGITSMGSTFCSVRSLRYVIFPIQVLAKSCKPVPVMIMGAFMGKKYPIKKYINVCLIVAGVGLFMGGGDSNKKSGDSSSELSSSSQVVGIILLFISLCFDGGTGAYEDKLMAVHSVGPFDLMYNIQLGKTIIAGVSLLVLNQVHVFLQMCQEMGFVLVALGLTGAMGQVFIFVTISKFGALTCSIIGLARKVTTLVASIYIYGHHLNAIQSTGLVISVSAMIMNFMGKGKKGGAHGHGHGHGQGNCPGMNSKEFEGQDSYKDIDVCNQKMEDLIKNDIDLSTGNNSNKPITAGGR